MLIPGPIIYRQLEAELELIGSAGVNCRNDFYASGSIST